MSRTHDWLNLVEVSGPFLAEQVLNKTLPDGLDTLQQGVAPRLRSAYNEWRDAVDTQDKEIDELHSAWLDEVLFGVLEYDNRCLKRGNELMINLPEHGVDLSPDMILVNPSKPEKPLLLISKYDPDLDLTKTIKIDGLASTPSERMVTLLRRTGNVLGLVTNGEAWMLVHAPSGAVASYTTWYARMFGQARDTLRAFASLLGIHRFTGPSVDALPSLFELSLEHQADVTEALGDQVAKAIEVLMRALDRADQDRNRDLLRDVAPSTLYEAGLTLMMRLVFILSAEERGLLLLGDPIYDSHYAISSLRSQLAGTDPAILERRNSAWSRMLATFRLVHDGVDHPNLRLHALGGSLFDPDRFPFLEGRKKGSDWHEDPADPLPIDDRTVLLLLEAIQVLKGRNLSYRALDVEQIGHVYEGLLDQTVGRVEGITLQLKGSAKIGTPLIQLHALESAQNKSSDDLLALLEERTERSYSALQNDVGTPSEKETAARLLTGCRGDATLRDRILPFANLLANDPWGLPLVHHSGAIVIIHGTDRRESGAHYTPKSLTEKIVSETLTPIVYRGPAEGWDRKDWALKSPAELLDLKICDPAMGSGAFLVQVCRWLSDRLVEAWAAEENKGLFVDAEGNVYSDIESISDPLDSEPEERAVQARRLIAEKCLYGVDMNPLAVELAKLSLWLTTVAKGRPFGFLDHNLRNGDSLLGINDLEQLIELDMKPSKSGQLRLFGRTIRKAVDEAMELRSRLREHPIWDIEDVKAMARLDLASRQALELPKLIADAFVGCVLAEKNVMVRNASIENVAALADAAAESELKSTETLFGIASRDLAKDEPHNHPRRPFHWPLEFPEVFGREISGFDAFVGNPPFVGGHRITGAMGTAYRDWLVEILAERRKGAADLVAFFFLRVASLLRQGGGFGLLATNSIAEGDTRQIGLEAMLNMGFDIYAGYPSEKWPGAASVVTSRVHMHKGEWKGEKRLSGNVVNHVSAFLSDREEWSPKRLKSNAGIAFQGSCVLGKGFILNADDASRMLDADPRNADVIFPYLNGLELNSDPVQRPSRFIINFWDWPEERARQYALPYEWIKNTVYPERLKKSSQKSYKEIMLNWWLHWRPRAELYHFIGRGDKFENHPGGWSSGTHKFDRVLAVTRVSKTLGFSFIPNDMIYSDAVVLVMSEKASLFATLQSSIHTAFAWQNSSRLKNDLRYSPSDALETFPFPVHSNSNSLEALGSELDILRSDIMASEGYGLTKLYGRMHSKKEISSQLTKMRNLLCEIDFALMRAYGWGDLDLGHGFHEVPYLPKNDRVRFTFSEHARREVLKRLANLNRERYQEEVDQELQGVDKTKKKPGQTKKSRSATTEPTLALDMPETPLPSLNQTKDAIISFLRSRGGSHGERSIFTAVRMKSSEWLVAKEELISEGRVLRHGVTPQETYSISERDLND